MPWHVVFRAHGLPPLPWVTLLVVVVLRGFVECRDALDRFMSVMAALVLAVYEYFDLDSMRMHANDAALKLVARNANAIAKLQLRRWVVMCHSR